MKLITILLTATILQVSAAGMAQQLTLKRKSIPVRDIFTEIRKQTGYSVLWESGSLDAAKKMSVDFNAAPLADVLAKVLDPSTHSYSIDEQTVIIQPLHEKTVIEKIRDFFFSIDASGKVADENGQPLPGATITLKGGGSATTSAADGSFVIRDVEEKAIILISMMGYATKEIPAAKEMGTIRLVPSVNPLDEVQVIAYGQTTKRLNTGNVATLKSEDIARQPVNNVLGAISGRLSGVLITQQSGVPGGGYKVQIRGQNSIGQSMDPLYIIDGVPYTSNLLPTVGGTIISGGSPLNFISPSDIESVDVLKDADATAIYGSRGSNGVILITTKKGRSGDTKIDINAYTGVSYVSRKPKLMDRDQYLQMRREAFANDNLTPTSTAYDLFGIYDLNRNFDWVEEIIGGRGTIQDYQGAVSGGGALFSYRFGGGYRRETPLFRGDFSDHRASASFNLNAHSKNGKFQAGFSANFLADKNNLPQVDITESILLSPVAPDPLLADGGVNYGPSGVFSNNPYQYSLSWYRGTTRNLVANTILSYEPAKGLKIMASAGYTNMDLKETNASTIASIITYPGLVNPQGSARFADNNIRSWILEPQLRYETKLGPGKLTTLLGTTFQESLTDGQIINGTGYANDALLGSLSAAAAITKGTITFEQYKYTAIYARLNYDISQKYLLNLTARRDGSSRFGPGKQFGNFGAIGAGWIFSKEDFVKEAIPALSFGKLRASYGSVGNQPGGNYQYLELYNFTTAAVAYQGGQGLVPNNLFVPDYSWEVNRKLEGGIELGAFDDAILLSAAYFRNRCGNQLVSYNVPNVTGFGNLTANLPAVVQNTGWEFVLSTRNLSAGKLKWTTNFNLTSSRNKLLSFPKIEQTSYNSTLVVGQPINVIRAFELAGVDPLTGIYQFFDANGKVTSTPLASVDNTARINLSPSFYGGLQNNLSYGGFQLDIFLQFIRQLGQNYLLSNSSPTGFGTFNRPVEFLDRWQKPGDIATYQRYTSQNSGTVANAYANARSSTLNYSDASFIRLKNVSLSYQLPEKAARKLKMNSLRLYLQGQNLLTISGYKGVDPESQSITALPPLQAWTAGVQFTF